MMELVTTKCTEAKRFIPRGKRNNSKTRVSPWFNWRCKEVKAKYARARTKYRRQRTQENKEMSRRTRNVLLAIGFFSPI